MEAEVLDLTTAARAAQVIAPEVQLARLQVLEAEFSLVEAEIGNGPTRKR